MKILMYSAIFPPAIGGPATQCFNLCNALVEKGEIPVVVTYGSTFSLNNKNGFNLYTFRLRYSYTFLDKIIRWAIFPFYILYIIKKENVQIVHCHSLSAQSFITGAIAKVLGIPSVIKFAGDWVWETLSTYKLQAKDFDEMYKKSITARVMVYVEKVGLNLFNKIWVVSDFRRGNIKKLLGTDNKVVVINNCLLLEGGSARKWNPSDPVIVISANRFIPHKRIDFMVELFAKMDIDNSKLVLIGGGAEKEVLKVKETIKRLKLEDKVELKGILSMNDVYSEFKKASFYISTSIEEGFPNVFIEAMHYGLPVLTSDAGGSGELVLDKKSGFVVGVYDENDFIEKMKILGSDLSVREKLSEGAYNRSNDFNLKYKISEFIQLYKGLLNKK